MKALVIGYGSMGSRHARILKEMSLDVAVVSRREIDEHRSFNTIPEALEGWCPDYVVAAQRTAERLSDFKILANTGFKGKILLEKPLFHRFTKIPSHSFASVKVAYNLRFHPIIQRLREIASTATIHAAHVYVGQHLSLWRPDADYRDGYSAQKSEGGGVLRDLSHELDYLNWILGGWTRLTATGGHFSGLEINSDDVFSILFESKNCPVVTVNMNYLDTSPRREIILLTNKGSVYADLINGCVEFAGDAEHLKTGIDETVVAEHKAVLNDDESVICSLEESMETLRMIEAAEQSALEKVWVTR